MTMTRSDSVCDSNHQAAVASNHIKDEPLEQICVEWFRDKALQLPDLDIVVSGMAGRFPKADSVNEFEANLHQIVDMIQDNDNLRWPCGKWGLPTRYGRLKSLEKFDHEFFGGERDNANKQDPQTRLLYEVVYGSIIDAGLNPSQPRGSNTACLNGSSCPDVSIFSNKILDSNLQREHDVSTEMCKYFGFTGPSSNFDAAFSSGFTALHSGIQTILNGDADRAIVCTTKCPLNPSFSRGFLDIGSLSPDGKIKFMDEDAKGYVRSEAVVSIVLKRRATAKRFYHTLMTSQSSDGYKIEGFTYPSGKSQAELHKLAKIFYISNDDP